MAKKSKRFEPAVKLAQSKEQLAAAKLTEQQRRVDEHQRMLKQLNAYQEEYQEQMRQSANKVLSSGRIRGYQSFVRKLTEAIRRQEQVVKEAQRQLEKIRNEWQACRSTQLSYEKIHNGFVADERSVEEKRMQKELDELAQQIGFRREESH